MRLNEYHNAGRCTYSRKGMPWKLVYFETFHAEIEAIRREKYIKKMKSRRYIEQLIRDFDKQSNPDS